MKGTVEFKRRALLAFQNTLLHTGGIGPGCA